MAVPCRYYDTKAWTFRGGLRVASTIASDFFSMPAGSQAITFNTGANTSTVGAANNVNVTAGQNYTLIVRPPASGSAALQTTLVTGC